MQGDRVERIELSLVPVQFGERQDLCGQFGLSTVSLEIPNLKRTGDVGSGILPVEWYAAASVKDRAFFIQDDVCASKRWVSQTIQRLTRKVRGPEHFYTFNAMNALAFSYSAAHRWDEAVQLQEETLALSRKIRGPEHPDTLSAMGSLAIFYGEAGKQNKALELREETLALYRRIFGPEHLKTLGPMHNLANSYYLAGRRNEALELRKQRLALSLKVFGPAHPEILIAKREVAISYRDAGDIAKAEALEAEIAAAKAKGAASSQASGETGGL